MQNLIRTSIQGVHVPNIYRNCKYIEVCSANRDRIQYPNPSTFVVQLGNSALQTNSFTSIDPVYYGISLFPPVQQSFPTTYPDYSYIYGTTLNGGATSDYIVSILPVHSNTYQDNEIITPSMVEQNYTGNFVELISNVVSSAETTSHEFRMITNYTKNKNIQYITADVDNTDGPILIDSISLGNFTSDIDHILDGWTIEFTNTTDTDLTGITRTVVYYRAYDQRVFFDKPVTEATITNGDSVVLKILSYQITLASPFSTGSLPTLGNNITQSDFTTARIRHEAPLAQGTLTAGSELTFTLPASVTQNVLGYVIWITSDPVVLTGSLTSASFVSDGTNQIQGTFVLSNGSAFDDDFLNGMEIHITSGNFSGYYYTITNWIQGSQTGTITPGWNSLIVGTTSPAPGDTFEIIQPNPSQYRLITSYNRTTRVGTVKVPFSYTNQQGIVTKYAVNSSTTFDILQFHQDSYQSLDMSQSAVLGQGVCCYEMELVSLTIPNVKIKSGEGGSVSSYPYFYVELKSLPQDTNENAIYSNNPGAKRAIFRATFFYNDSMNVFSLLDGHGMVQTLKLSMNSSFLFSVYLPNGEPMIFQDDYIFPSECNPLLQISACFSIRRV
jgi:hypothetical protein